MTTQMDWMEYIPSERKTDIDIAMETNLVNYQDIAMFSMAMLV